MAEDEDGQLAPSVLSYEIILPSSDAVALFDLTPKAGDNTVSIITAIAPGGPRR